MSYRMRIAVSQVRFQSRSFLMECCFIQTVPEKEHLEMCVHFPDDEDVSRRPSPLSMVLNSAPNGPFTVPAPGATTALTSLETWPPSPLGVPGVLITTKLVSAAEAEVCCERRHPALSFTCLLGYEQLRRTPLEDIPGTICFRQSTECGARRK